MVIDVSCLTVSSSWRYRLIAEAMAQGVNAAGDRARVLGLGMAAKGRVGIMYGWKHNAYLRAYPKFIYADLGYWARDSYYRFSVGGWSPHKYVRAGNDSSRFDQLGLTIKPWHDGEEIVIAGSSPKSARDHGLGYMAWETKAAERLKGCGYRVLYRPKPSDAQARDIPGVETDRRPVSEMLANARALVTHHSNCAVDALLAGVPVHCETGAAAAFSVPMDEIANAPRMEGREQFLHDVAWLQWTEAEMRSGEAWKHLRTML